MVFKLENRIHKKGVMHLGGGSDVASRAGAHSVHFTYFPIGISNNYVLFVPSQAFPPRTAPWRRYFISVCPNLSLFRSCREARTSCLSQPYFLIGFLRFKQISRMVLLVSLPMTTQALTYKPFCS